MAVCSAFFPMQKSAKKDKSNYFCMLFIAFTENTSADVIL